MRSAAYLLLALLAACGGGSEVGWIHLSSAGVHEREKGTSMGGLLAEGCGLLVEDDHAWVEMELGREDWTFRPGTKVWKAPVTIRGFGVPRDGTPPQRLRAGKREFRYFPSSNIKAKNMPEPGDFLSHRGGVQLRLSDGAVPPERTVLSVFVDRGQDRRVVGSRFSGDGLSVWAGERVRVQLELAGESVLRFATCVEPAPFEALRPTPVTFSVALDGRPLFEHVEEDPAGESYAWHELELPPASGRGAELVFSVDGGLCSSSFLAPVIGPRSKGSYGDRPWPGARPDIVLFLADTFRADNLSAYGGVLEVAPNLDALAEQALVFRRAWSTSTHTLPATASLFGGVFPRQAGAMGTDQAVPKGVRTIAERLQGFGYRTGAVTDSVILSERYGMDQGFEWFDEKLESLDSTLERARSFLDADDGRPLFLVVHTYRAHTPFHVESKTLAEHGERLGITGDYEGLNARLAVFLKNPEERGAEEEEALMRELEGFYRGGVIDLDRAFGEFYRELAQRGILDAGHLVFTSDHGEAFREHGTLYHGGRVWEELTRIPLLVWGNGVEPGFVDLAASLVDIAPTLAAMAGVAPDSDWVGAALLSLDHDRPVFAFQCYKDSPRSSLALIDGDLKIITFENADLVQQGEMLFAFDLASDPGELTSLHEREDWPRELQRRIAPTLAPLLQPLYEQRQAHLGAGDLEQLDALGYTGE